MSSDFWLNISAQAMRRWITILSEGYTFWWILFFVIVKLYTFSEESLISTMIWSLNFLAYAAKFFSVTRWIGQIELHVTSASELPITWFHSIHWNFPPNCIPQIWILSKIEILKKPQVLVFAIWNSGSANDS